MRTFMVIYDHVLYYISFILTFQVNTILELGSQAFNYTLY